MWQVEYTNRFLKELAALPAEIRSRIEPIVFQFLESDNPFALGYLEKMKGYPDKYKIRVVTTVLDSQLMHRQKL